MGNVSVRPAVQRQSLIPKYGLQIGERGDRWEEEFIKNIDFSTMDNGEDWSSLFRYSKAKDFDLTALDSENVTNMDYLFDGVDSSTLHLAGLVVGPETTGNFMFRGTFDNIDFTGAKFYHIPHNMFADMRIRETLRLGTLNASHITSLNSLLLGVTLPALDLTGFDTSNVTNMYGMFQSANIGEIIGLRDLDFSNVTDASYMFAYYKGPYSLDLSGIKFSSLEKAYYMFDYINEKAINNHSNFTLNLSNCYFPALTDAQGMFYMRSPYQDEEKDYGKVDLITDGMVIKSLGLRTGQMFSYFRSVDNKGLDLSFLKDAKIAYSSEMFQYAQLGLTDFTVLDFSEATYVGYTFRRLNTPLIHVQTHFGLQGNSSLNNFFYEVEADEVIIELTTSKNVGSAGYLFTYPRKNTILTIQNSDIYASNWYDFLYSYSDSAYGDLRATIKDSTLHFGQGSNVDYFATNYGKAKGSYIDMSKATIDGYAKSIRYMFGDTPNFEEIKFPESGMKIVGTLGYLSRGYSVYDPETQQSHYESAKLYNIDKFDTSEMREISYLLYNTNLSCDLSSWNTESLTRIYYILDDCFGEYYNFSNWNTDKVTYIEIGYGLRGRLDIRNWNASNATYITGVSSFYSGSIDFDGWRINKDQYVTNCWLVFATTERRQEGHGTIYVPNTVYQPDSYTGSMFNGSTPSQYYLPMVVDLYTNATSLEEQGWRFYHLYSEEEPWGYRIHWGSTHEDFLNAIEGQEGGD